MKEDNHTEKSNHGIPENFVIVIGRQFGSGGRTVGKLIASKLGIGYYDSELVRRAAESVGIDPQIFKEHEEKRPNIFKTLLQGLYGIADNFHTVPLSSERIYRLQAQVIQDICKKGSCVIVGRNADFILRSHPKLLSVFLHAPISHRVKRILNRREAISEEEAVNIAEKHDRRREAYYNFYTGENKWGVASNYHLSLDTSNLGDEAIAHTIIGVAKAKFNGKN